jgi:hypothetical protein
MRVHGAGAEALAPQSAGGRWRRFASGRCCRGGRGRCGGKLTASSCSEGGADVCHKGPSNRASPADLAIKQATQLTEDL